MGLCRRETCLETGGLRRVAEGFFQWNPLASLPPSFGPVRSRRDYVQDSVTHPTVAAQPHSHAAGLPEIASQATCCRSQIRS
jgi:hypothetical protein